MPQEEWVNSSRLNARLKYETIKLASVTADLWSLLRKGPANTHPVPWNLLIRKEQIINHNLGKIKAELVP